jgi:uncharacterized protein YbjQ (UPF0145 family)
MLLTTTATLEGKRITKYHGLVSSEVILGANLFKDMLAGIRDMVGGRSGAYEKELRKAKELALEEMKTAAQRFGANAIVGIHLEYEQIGPGRGGMLMVAVSGTAVNYSD